MTDPINRFPSQAVAYPSGGDGRSWTLIDTARGPREGASRWS